MGQYLDTEQVNMNLCDKAVKKVTAKGSVGASTGKGQLIQFRVGNGARNVTKNILEVDL
jgi:hypothetical protein